MSGRGKGGKAHRKVMVARLFAAKRILNFK